MTEKNMVNLLNMNTMTLTNIEGYSGEYDFPNLFCDSTPNIDYLAMYSRPSEYSKHENSALCFYQYDKTYDGLNGIYNAIFYKKKSLLKQYKKRFKDIKIAIDPDYSIGQNFPKAENIYRMYKSRIVGLWLKYKCGITVIPNLTYVDESYFPFMLNGIENTKSIAMSIVGVMNSIQTLRLFNKALKYAVDHLKNLKIIYAFTTNSDDEETKKLFSYAKKKEIQICIPDNMLKRRNTNKQKEADKKFEEEMQKYVPLF